MPQLKHLREWLDTKIRKYGDEAHCSQPFVSEELRKNAIANKPDKDGKQKTRIGLETYSHTSYSRWNQMLEGLMKRCGYNPIIVVDLLELLVMEADMMVMDICECTHPARRHDVNERCLDCGCDIYRLGEFDGIDAALEGLYRVMDYPKELASAKAEKRALKKARIKEKP